jgi:hypothetical protein
MENEQGNEVITTEVGGVGQEKTEQTLPPVVEVVKEEVKKVLTKSEKVLKFINELSYMAGFLCVAIGTVGYIGVIMLFIVGIETTPPPLDLGIIYGVNLFMGVFTTAAFAYQGKISAEQEPELKALLNKQTELPTRKYKTERQFIIELAIKKFLFQIIPIVVMAAGPVFVMGNGDWSLVLGAISNIILFLGIGIITYKGSFKYYTKDYVGIVKNKIKELERETERAELKKIELENKKQEIKRRKKK